MENICKNLDLLKIAYEKYDNLDEAADVCYKDWVVYKNDDEAIVPTLSTYTKFCKAEKAYDNHAIKNIINSAIKLGENAFKKLDWEENEKDTFLQINSKNIVAHILAMNNVIMLKSRLGRSNACLISENIYNLLKETIDYNPIDITSLNAENTENAELVEVGTLAGINVVLDKSLENTICVYRSEKDEPGIRVILCNEHYGIEEIGFYPETCFMTIHPKIEE